MAVSVERGSFQRQVVVQIDPLKPKRLYDVVVNSDLEESFVWWAPGATNVAVTFKGANPEAEFVDKDKDLEANLKTLNTKVARSHNGAYAELTFENYSAVVERTTGAGTVLKYEITVTYPDGEGGAGHTLVIDPMGKIQP